MKKRLLILRACGHADETEECNGIAGQAKLYGLEVDDYCPKSNLEVDQHLSNGNHYNYIYLSSHGDAEGFSNEKYTVDLSWMDFGNILCNSECMNDDCVVFLSCCRGGLNQVAYDLMFCCGKISYIVGPRQSLTSIEMLICFNVFFYNNHERRIDPVVCCKKIESATDIRFVSFDRLETETEMSFIQHRNRRLKEIEDQEKMLQELMEKQDQSQLSVIRVPDLIKSSDARVASS